MLRRMRDDFKKYSWTLWLVIIAFLIGFSLTDLFSGGSIEKSDLISIDGTAIKGIVFQKQIIQTLESYKRQFKENFNKSLIQQLKIPERILQDIINSTIIEKEAKKMNLNISKDELRDKILNYSETYNDKKKGPVEVYVFREDGKSDGKFIGIKEYEQLLAYSHRKIKDFENSLKKQIIVEKLRELVTSTLVIDEETLRDKYKKEKDNVNLDYILLNPDRIKEKINVSDDVLKKYYNNNKQKFKSKEKRSGYIVSYKYDDFKKDIKIKEEELYKYWKKNKELFKVPAKTKISRIFLNYDKNNREKILKRAEELVKELNLKNFSQKAKEVSQDDKAKKGGDWGYWEWKNLTPQEKSMIDIVNQNEISSPVDTKKGFSILLVNEKIKEYTENYNQTKSKIKNIIEKDKVNTFVKDKLEKIYIKIKNENSIKNSAKKLGIKIIESKLLTNGESIKEIDDMGYISRRLFTLKEDEINFPVEFFKGIAIVQLSNIKKPEIQKFTQIKEKVLKKVIQLKKMDLLIEDAQRILNKLIKITKNKEIEKYLKEKNLKSTNSTYKRGNKFSYFPTKKGMDDIIFSLKENQFSSPLKFDTAVVIVKVKNKVVTGLIEFEHDKIDYYIKKIQEMKNNYFMSYILNIREKYEKNKKILFNQNLFDKIKNQISSRYK